MAGTLPTGILRLTDIINEINAIFTRLSECIANADGTFDNTYYVAPTDSIGDFRGYSSDTQAPTAPTNLSSSNKTSTSFTLSWTASTDNVAVTGYKIYDDGVLNVDTGSTLTSKTLSNLTRNDQSTWTVKAYDAVGNLSAASTGLVVTLLRETVQMLTTGESTSALACGQSGFTDRYHNGTGLYPVVGNTIYTTSSSIGTFDGDDLFYLDFNEVPAQTYEIDKNGDVQSVTTC